MSAPKSVLNTDPTALHHRVLVGTPTLGLVRMEWHNAMQGLVVPCNWANSTLTPQGFRTADAQNILAKEAIEKGFEYLLLIEDDTIPPLDLFLRFNEHMKDPASPLISGLYYLKPGVYSTAQPEPLMYRGRGNGAFTNWKPGARVWVDGVPTGCLLIHKSVLKAVWDRAETYTLHANGGILPLRRVFQSPRQVFTDVVLGSYQKVVGTSDLFFCDQILRENLLAETGWKALSRKKHPFLVDTGIRCRHIDLSTGLAV